MCLMMNRNHYQQQYHYHTTPSSESRSEASNQRENFTDVVIRRTDEIIIARAGVELYSANSGDRKWILNEIGIIYLIQKHDTNIYYLVLYETDNTEERPLWKQEIDRHIVYKIDKPYFHILFIQNQIYGLNFAELAEAEMLYFAMERLGTPKNFSKMINHFTSRLSNFFTRKRRSPSPIMEHNNKPRKPRNYYESHNTRNKPYFSYEFANPGSYQSQNGPHIKNYVHYTNNEDGDDEYDSYDGFVTSSEVPKPPPLPPPVPNFHFTSNRIPPKILKTASRYDHGGSVCNSANSTNSFESQIKCEAKKHRVGGKSYFKKLP